MHIVCPHCTTSYAIDLATLGAAGRTVRCSRCKEVWLARPEDAIEIAASAMAAAGKADAERDAAAEWERWRAEDDSREQDTPVVDSPSISGDWLARGRRRRARGRRSRLAVGSPARRHDAEAARPQRLSRLRNLLKPPALLRGSGKRIRRPAHGLRRDGRAGAGAGDLARRRGAAAAADRRRSTKWSASR